MSEIDGIKYEFKEDCGKVGCWVLQRGEYKRIYNADLFRLDQAIRSFKSYADED